MADAKRTKIRRIIMIIAFYCINFGLWELLVRFIPKEWASFVVYLVLFPVTFILLGKQLKQEWINFVHSLKSGRSGRRFAIELIAAMLIYLILFGLETLLASRFGWNITPQNSENVSVQLHAIPTFLTVIQTCIFAPVIEEMTFRYSIIGHAGRENRLLISILCIVSIILFDTIHIFVFSEFFYYLPPAIVLTGIYVRRDNVMASIILHSVLNIAGTLLLLLQ